MPERPVLGAGRRRPVVIAHGSLLGRDEPDQHPVEAIGGLDAWLVGKLIAGSNITLQVDDDGVITISASGGGGGAVDSVNGETGAVVLDAADVGALASGSGYNTANGWLKLDGSGTAPDSTIPASIARDSEVSSAVSAHAGATDPHGDRAYVDGLTGTANGIAELDSNGFVPSAQLPSYVDDVVEAANLAALPGTGETGKIYVTLDNNLTFRWSGSAYVEISASLALGETSSTAYRGDRGKTAYDHSQATGNPHGAAVADITGLTSALDGKAATSHSHSGSDITSGTVSTARLGTGAADATTFLRGDGRWGVMAHDQHVESGLYTTGPGMSAASNTLHYLVAVGVQVWHPIWLTAGTYDRIGVITTVAGTSTWRLGVDSATAGLRPGTNLLDAGTVNMSASPGLLTATISFVVPATGWYFARAKCETYTSSPTAYIVDGITAQPTLHVPGWPTIVTSSPTRQQISMYAGGTAGAFTDPPVMTGNPSTGIQYWQTGARLYLRRSA